MVFHNRRNTRYEITIKKIIKEIVLLDAGGLLYSLLHFCRIVNETPMGGFQVCP